MSEFYPRMTKKVRSILIGVRYGDITRETIKPGHKAIAQKLMWDGWITVLDPDHEPCPTHLEPGDLALTIAGTAWLNRQLAIEAKDIEEESE